MGWTETAYFGRNNAEDLQRFFASRFTPLTFLKFAKVGKVCYAAVTHEEKTFCVVILTEVDTKNNQICYKDMDESMGPFYYTCPPSILNLLSPTEFRNAQAWREKCRENAKAKQANRGKFKVGDTVVFKTSLTFNSGKQEDTFVVQCLKPLRFKYGQFGTWLKIPRGYFADPEAYEINPGA